MSTEITPLRNFLRELVFALFYRKQVVISVTMGFVLLGLVAAVLLPSQYRSSAKYLISLNEQIDPLQRDRGYDIRNQMTRVIQGQKEIIFSHKVLEGAAKRLYPDASDEKLIRIVSGLSEKIVVSPPKGENFEGSNIYYLTCEASTPERAHSFAVGMTEAYRDVYWELSKEKSRYSHSFFTEQVAEIEKNLDEKTRKLRRFEEKHSASLVSLLNLESGKTNTEVGPQALHTQISGELYSLKQQLSANRQLISSLEKAAQSPEIPVVLPDMEGVGKALTTYRNKVSQLQLQLNEMRTQFSPDYLPLQQIAQELKHNVGLIREEYSAIIKARRIQGQNLEAQIAQTNNALKELEETIRANAQERSAYESLKQDYALAREDYTRAMNKLEQARMASSLNEEKQNITMVEEPQLPLKPFRPNRLLILLIAVLSGVFLGVGIALLLDYFDHSIKTQEEIEDSLGIPCLGSVSGQQT